MAVAIGALATALTALIFARQVPGIAGFRWETDNASAEITDTEISGDEGAYVLTKEAPGRYDATECPGQPFLWLSARESARTRALSGGSPLGRVVLGALDFLGQALG